MDVQETQKLTAEGILLPLTEKRNRETGCTETRTPVTPPSKTTPPPVLTRHRMVVHRLRVRGKIVAKDGNRLGGARETGSITLGMGVKQWLLCREEEKIPMMSQDGATQGMLVGKARGALDRGQEAVPLLRKSSADVISIITIGTGGRSPHPHVDVVPRIFFMMNRCMLL